MRLFLYCAVLLAGLWPALGTASPLTERADVGRRIVDTMRARLVTLIAAQGERPGEGQLRLKGLLRVAETAAVQASEAAALGNAQRVDEAMAKVTLAAWHAEADDGEAGLSRAKLTFWVSPAVRTDDPTLNRTALYVAPRTGL